MSDIWIIILLLLLCFLFLLIFYLRQKHSLAADTAAVGNLKVVDDHHSPVTPQQLNPISTRYNLPQPVKSERKKKLKNDLNVSKPAQDENLASSDHQKFIEDFDRRDARRKQLQKENEEKLKSLLSWTSPFSQTTNNHNEKLEKTRNKFSPIKRKYKINEAEVKIDLSPTKTKRKSKVEDVEDTKLKFSREKKKEESPSTQNHNEKVLEKTRKDISLTKRRYKIKEAEVKIDEDLSPTKTKRKSKVKDIEDTKLRFSREKQREESPCEGQEVSKIINFVKITTQKAAPQYKPRNRLSEVAQRATPAAVPTPPRRKRVKVRTALVCQLPGSVDVVEKLEEVPGAEQVQAELTTTHRQDREGGTL